jgi:hypothetical protein
MKLISNILVCALATGLMTVATQQVQAASGIVIDNTLYAPLKISVSATVEVGGRSKRVNVTEAEIIAALSLPVKTTLAVSADTGDVWAIDSTTKTLNEDLTVDGNFTITNDETSSIQKGTTTVTITETGSVAVGIFSDPIFVDGVLDVADSEVESASWIELSGEYKLIRTRGAPKNGDEKVSVSYTAKGLNGSIHDSGETEPATGSVSGSGSGTVAGI